MINNFLKESKIPLRGALFISGSGSNAEKIIEYSRKIASETWTPVVIITDKPETSRAIEIGSSFNIPVLGIDIKKEFPL